MIFHNDGLGLLTRWIGAGLVQLQHDAPISQSSSGISSKCAILAISKDYPRPNHSSVPYIEPEYLEYELLHKVINYLAYRL